MNEKCQVFTPTDYVEELLDSVDYKEGLYGRKILENSCGDGNILTAVVQRYIADCQKQGVSQTQIRNGLQRDIYGIEIDAKQHRRCIEKLNRILAEQDIGPVEWNIFNTDYLRWNTKETFCFVVGNPPYITYQEIEESDREYVRRNFQTCEKGKYDYCYAFIEKSIGHLSADGKMAYLIPSSIYKTVFGEKLRRHMSPYIELIIDYTQEKMFNQALVKSSIMVLNRNRRNERLHYVDKARGIDRQILIGNLGAKWFFTNDAAKGTRRFGEHFRVSHVVATLLNEAYVLKDGEYDEEADFIVCRGHQIEKSLVRVTASPRSLRYGKKEKIIFPYMYCDGQLVRLSLEQFEEQFRGTAGYLNEFRKKLDKRKKDNNTLWFEYGRSQALAELNVEKLLVSTVVTETVPVYLLSVDCIPYAGMFIIPRDHTGQYTLEDAREILQSTKFMKYVQEVGIPISGSSLRITSKDIEDYMF